MKGTIRIFSSKRHLGRIILEDGRESSIMVFPGCFEDGDIANAEFRSQDPAQKLISLTALSKEWHFGLVIIPPEQGRKSGRILITYPRPKGTLFFYTSKLPHSLEMDKLRYRKLKFKIRKNLDGKQQAVEIKDKLQRSEWHKCTAPEFGLLKTMQSNLQTGIVQRLVAPVDQTTHSGVIKILHTYKNTDQPSFGFITQESGQPEVFFNVKAYERFYSRPPTEGDQVHFKIMESPKGLGVKRFCGIDEEQAVLSEPQYGTFEPDAKPGNPLYFSAPDFKQTYGMEPVVGDFLYYQQPDKHHVILYPEGSGGTAQNHIQGRFNNPRTTPSHASPTPLEGFIDSYDTEKGFGFVRTYGVGEKYFFHISAYQKAFPKQTPVFCDPVTFTTGIDQSTKRTKVRMFSRSAIPSSHAAMETGSLLIDIDPTSLYYIYTKNNGQVAEFRRFDPAILSEAIACYKDRGLKAQHKLAAIESLVRSGYWDTRITQQGLKEERLAILQQCIKEHIQTGDFTTALEDETRLQQLHYEPGRLSEFTNMKPTHAFNISQPVSVVSDEHPPVPWKLELELDARPEVQPSDNPWQLMLEEQHGTPNIIAASNQWALDLESTNLPNQTFLAYFNDNQFALITDSQNNENEYNG